MSTEGSISRFDDADGQLGFRGSGRIEIHSLSDLLSNQNHLALEERDRVARSLGFGGLPSAPRRPDAEALAAHQAGIGSPRSLPHEVGPDGRCTACGMPREARGWKWGCSKAKPTLSDLGVAHAGSKLIMDPEMITCHDQDCDPAFWNRSPQDIVLALEARDSEIDLDSFDSIERLMQPDVTLHWGGGSSSKGAKKKRFKGGLTAVDEAAISSAESRFCR